MPQALSQTPSSQPRRISLVGLVLCQVLEVQRAAVDELVQGLLHAHQLLQLLPQLLLPRPLWLPNSPLPLGTEQPPHPTVSVSVSTQGPHPRAASKPPRRCRRNFQEEAVHRVYEGAPGLGRSVVLPSSQGTARIGNLSFGDWAREKKQVRA